MIKKTFILSTLTFCCLNLNSYASDSFKLNSVVSTGFYQDADDALRNVIVIDKASLQQGYSSLEQALKQVAGISFADFGLGSNIDLRGQGAKANTSVKVLLNSQSINLLDNSHGVTPLNTINIDDIERIEIIPGGGSVLYGSGTRGGVINIITKKYQKDSFSSTLLLSSQTKQSANFSVNMTKRLKNIGFGFDTTGFNKALNKEGDSTKGYFVNTYANLNLDDSSNLNLLFNYYKALDTSSGYLSLKQVKENPRQRGNADIKTKTNRPSLLLNYQKSFDNVDLSLDTSYTKQNIKYLKDRSELTRMNLTTPVSQDGSSFLDSLKTLNIKAKYNYLENSYFIIGSDNYKQDANRNSIVAYSVNTNQIKINHTMTTVMDMYKLSNSLFFLNKLDLTNFGISSGARLEFARFSTKRHYNSNMLLMNKPIVSNQYFNTKNNTSNTAFEITPYIKPTDTTLAYLKFEHGFISPSPAQFVNKDQKSQNYYSSNLKSELFNTVELGFNNYLDRVNFNINLFLTQSKNEISYLGDPHSSNGAFWKYYNIDQTRRSGLEINIESLLSEKLTYKQSIAYIDARISRGINKNLEIPYVSKLKTTSSFDYKINQNLSSFINLLYFSKALDGGTSDANTGKISNNAYINGYLLTDLGVSYSKNNLNTQLGIKNIFNKTYYSYQNKADDNYLVGSGRSVYLEVKYAF